MWVTFVKAYYVSDTEMDAKKADMVPAQMQLLLSDIRAEVRAKRW